MSSRFFGPNKLISDASIKRWISSVNPPSAQRQAVVNRPLFAANSDLEDPVLEAAYAETRTFVDKFIHSNDNEHLSEELKFFEKYDNEVAVDLQFDNNGAAKISPLPPKPNLPLVDYDQPDDAIVNSIIEKLLEKPIFPREFNEVDYADGTTFDVTLGQSKKVKISSRSAPVPSGRTPDFLARQRVRQEIAKQQREKREVEEQARKREEIAKREMQAEAKRRAAIEQRERELKEKAEEEEIKREMAKIKQQLESQRKLMSKITSEKRAVAETTEALVRAELDLETEKKLEIEEGARAILDEQRRLKLARIEQIMTARNTENIKLMQRCFKSWYNEVMENRLTVARFRAIKDWRRIVRSWNRWRAATNKIIAHKEALKHAEQMKKEYKREAAAENFCRRKILAQCLEEWRLFVKQKLELRAAEKAKEERRAKMASFLAAAAAATVVEQNVPKGEVKVCDPIVSKGIDELFASPQKGFKLDLKQLSSGDEDRRLPDTQKKQHMKKSSRRVASAGSNQLQKSKNIANDVFTDSQSDQEGADELPSTANLRHVSDRNAARQKQIINLQRERIRDQQMLIKELSFARKQTEMMQQISKYEELLRGLDQLTKAAVLQKPNSPKKQSNSTKQNSSQVLPESGQDLQHPASLTGESQANLNSKPDEEANEGNTEKRESQSSPLQSPLDEQVQLQLHEVVKLFHESKRTPADNSIATPSSNAQASTRRTWSARSQANSEFTKKMEERAEMRRKLKEEREKKKQEAEQKRIEEEKQMEEEQRRREEDEKRAKFEELKRKKQLEKEREEQRLVQIQRDMELTSKAERADIVRILRHRAWLPWVRLIEMQREKWRVAVEHNSKKMQRRYLLAWSTYNRDDLTERFQRADTFYRRLIVQRCYSSWKKYGNYMLILEERADRHRRAVLILQYFNKWDRYVDQQRRKEIRDEEAADQHNVKRLLRFTFKSWLKIPIMIREERQRRKRLEDMRRRVAEILPDFNPAITAATPPPVQDSIAISSLEIETSNPEDKMQQV